MERTAHVVKSVSLVYKEALVPYKEGEYCFRLSMLVYKEALVPCREGKYCFRLSMLIYKEALVPH